MMATLAENIKQAIADFDEVKSALEESGVEVPYDTNTSEYGNLVRQAVSTSKGVFNAETHYDFPSVGDENIIYKAQSEKLIYQWNPAELKYEKLSSTADVEVEITNIELINGGNAYGNS